VCNEPSCARVAVCQCSFCAKAQCAQHQAVTRAGNGLKVCQRCLNLYQTSFAHSVPPTLVAAHNRWIAQGRRQQPGIAVDANLWVDTFPAVGALVATCPVVIGRNGRPLVTIDRAFATSLGDLALTTPQAAIDAHIISMMWGFGRSGYGPFRTGRHLSSTGAATNLQATAQTIQTSGIVAAFRMFVPKNATYRLDGLGSAFSTKDLFFFSNSPDRHRALIFDSVLSAWLSTNVGWDIAAGTEDLQNYCEYLLAMYSWAADLGESPEDVEYVIFG